MCVRSGGSWRGVAGEREGEKRGEQGRSGGARKEGCGWEEEAWSRQSWCSSARVGGGERISHGDLVDLVE